YPSCFSERDSGSIEQTVRRHDRCVGRNFRIQCTDTIAGAGGTDSSPSQRSVWPSRQVFRRIQSIVPQGDEWISHSQPQPDSEGRSECLDSCRLRVSRWCFWATLANKLSS